MLNAITLTQTTEWLSIASSAEIPVAVDEDRPAGKDAEHHREHHLEQVAKEARKVATSSVNDHVHGYSLLSGSRWRPCGNTPSGSA